MGDSEGRDLLVLLALVSTFAVVFHEKFMLGGCCCRGYKAEKARVTCPGRSFLAHLSPPQSAHKEPVGFIAYGGGRTEDTLQSVTCVGFVL